MASMRDIKRRRASIQSTSQITRAMKLVSTVKLQKAKGHAEETKPYFDKMYRTVSGMLAATDREAFSSLRKKEAEGKKKKGIILITSNRGLAGGYNANVVKLVKQGDFKPDDTTIYPVGRKGMEMIQRLGYMCQGDYCEVIDKPLFADAAAIGRDVMNAWQNAEIDEVYLAYTVFKNSVSQIPTLIRILPFGEDTAQEEAMSSQDTSDVLMNYEPKEEETLQYIIPLYVNSLIYGALVESSASENGARMQAMDSATGNAEEMIDTLGLQYNRARQAAITGELTEIVAGASAIS